MSARYKMELTLKKMKPLADIKPPSAAEAIREVTEDNEHPAMAFCHFVEPLQELIKNLLAICEPSAYRVNSPALNYKDVPPDKLMRNTGFNQQQLKSWPRVGQDVQKKVVDILNLYMQWSVEYCRLIDWYKDNYEKGLSWVMNIAKDLYACQLLRTQFLYLQIITECLIGRYFIRCRYNHFKGEIKEKNRDVAKNGKILEETIRDFQDQKIPESEAENLLGKQMKAVYLSVIETIKAWDSLVHFFNPKDDDLCQHGVCLVPDKQVLDQINNNIKWIKTNVIRKLASLQFRGGEAVNEGIIHKKLFHRILEKACLFDGVGFRSKILDAVDVNDDGDSEDGTEYDEDYVGLGETWQDIQSGIFKEVTIPDFTGLKEENVLEKDLLFKREEAVPKPINWVDDIKEKESKKKEEKSKDEEKEKVSKEDQKKKDNEKKESNGKDGGGPEDKDGRDGNGDDEDNESYGSWQDGDYDGEQGFNVQLQHYIDYCTRTLERVKPMVINRKEKVIMQNCQKDLHECQSKLGHCATTMGEVGSPNQWKVYEKLFKDVGLYLDKTLINLGEEETAAKFRQNLPRGQLKTWNAKVESYVNWRNHMKRALQYGDEEINVATLTKYIEGTEEDRTKVENRIGAAKTVDEVWAKLDPHYDDFAVVESCLEDKLDLLKSYPRTMKEELKNCEEIVNFMETMDNHGKRGEINQRFVNKFFKKLCYSNQGKVVDEKMFSYDTFYPYLQQIIKRDTYMSMNGGSQKEQGRGREKKPWNQQMNATEVRDGGNESGCYICGRDNHKSFKCLVLKNKKDLKEKIALLEQKGICKKCILKHDSNNNCSATRKKWICKTHNCNITCCGCKLPPRDVVVSCTTTEVDTAEEEIPEEEMFADEFDDEEEEEDEEPTINNAKVGCVSFMTEWVQFKGRDGVVKTHLLGYDSLASHSSGNSDKIQELCSVSKDLGNVAVKTYTGKTSERGKKAKLTIKAVTGEKKIEFLKLKNFKNQYKRVVHKIPKEWEDRLQTKKEFISHGGTSYFIISSDKPNLHPEVIEMHGSKVLVRSRLTGRYLVYGPGDSLLDEDAEQQCQYNKMSVEPTTTTPVIRAIKAIKPTKPTATAVALSSSVVEGEAPGTDAFEEDDDTLSISHPFPGKPGCGTMEGQHEENTGEKEGELHMGPSSAQQHFLTAGVATEDATLAGGDPRTAGVASEKATLAGDMQFGSQVQTDSEEATENSEEVPENDDTIKDSEAEPEEKRFETKHCHICQTEVQVECEKVSEEKVLKAMTTDFLQYSPLKRCKICKQCKNCSKPKSPGEEEQEDLLFAIKERLKFQEDKKRYIGDYLHTAALPRLKENKIQVLKMYPRVERQIINLGYGDQANKIIKKYIEDGVLKPVEEVPEAEGMQKSYIPWTFSLNKLDKDGNNRMRLCWNSSFHSGDGVSFNTTLVQPYSYLNRLEPVLTRWRCSNFFSYADIMSMYHQMDATLLNSSLRRVFLREDGFGGTGDLKEYLSMKLNWGDTPAGAYGQCAIDDALSEEVSTQLAKEVSTNNIMDDLTLLDNNRDTLDEKKTQVEEALSARGLPIKGWTTSGDPDPPQKFLSYIYSPASDTFQPNIRHNISPKKKGARAVKDVTRKEDVEEHHRVYPWNKRRLLSACMGVHDPLGIVQCLTNNLKFILKETTDAKLPMDEELNESQARRATEAVKLLVEARSLTLPRQALFPDAVEVCFDLYFDASMTGTGVVVVVKSTFEDGTSIYRFLKAKSKVNGGDLTTTPRAETVAALICARVLNLLRYDLKDFLASYKGKVSFRMIGDSMVVLESLLKPHYLFKMWQGCRLNEIKELCKGVDHEVTWWHTSTLENFSDCLTREFKGSYEQIPWSKDLVEPTTLKKIEKPTQDITALPEANMKKVQLQSNSTAVETEAATLLDLDLPQLLSFALLQEQFPNLDDDPEEETELDRIINDLLQKKSSYWIVRNTLAWMFYLKEKDFQKCQMLSEMAIFRSQQKQNKKYLKKFNGNQFTSTVIDGVYHVKGRNTVNGPTLLKVVPKNTKLYSVISRTFHRKYHRSAVFVRAMMLQHGYYLPAALHRLKKLSKDCCLCRRRERKSMMTLMGPLGNRRLGKRGFLDTTVGDVSGPYLVKDFVNKRAPSRKMWLLLLVDEFSRYCIIHPLESLSKQSLLDAFEAITFRYKVIRRCYTDCGTNFLSMANEEDSVMSEEEMRRFGAEMRSRGTEIKMRVPHAPWISGGAEAQMKNLAKAMTNMKHTMNPFKWSRSLEKIQFLVNSRPVGLSTNLEVLTPNDISSLHSNIEPVNSFEEFVQKSEENVKLFAEKWMSHYWSDLRSQKKWWRSDKIAKDSCVLILDTKNNIGFPTLGRVVEVEKGSHDDEDRYFKVEYLTKGGQRRTVRRPSQQLSMVLRPEEDVPNPDDVQGGDDQPQPEDVTEEAGDGQQQPEDVVVNQGGDAAVDEDADETEIEPATEEAVPAVNELTNPQEDEGQTVAEADVLPGNIDEANEEHVDEEADDKDPLEEDLGGPDAPAVVKDVIDEPEVDKKKVKVQFTDGSSNKIEETYKLKKVKKNKKKRRRN